MEEEEEEREAPRSPKRERSPDRASRGEGAEGEVLPDPGKKKRRKGVVYRGCLLYTYPGPRD